MQALGALHILHILMSDYYYLFFLFIIILFFTNVLKIKNLNLQRHSNL